jgi:RNA polymerase sigma-70 factor (ECF subfamily)
MKNLSNFDSSHTLRAMSNPPHDLSNFPTQEKNWASLIFQISKGDESSLNKFYENTKHLVYGLTLRILGDVAEAEEVTVDVYMQVWNKASDYDPERGTPSSWLLMLTRSRAIERLRSGARRRNLEEPIINEIPNPSLNPEENVLEAEKRRAVQDAFAKLSPQQRQAIELAYFSGLSQSEIATRLGHPIGTVKSWIRLGMMKLREVLIPPEGE